MRRHLPLLAILLVIAACFIGALWLRGQRPVPPTPTATIRTVTPSATPTRTPTSEPVRNTATPTPTITATLSPTSTDVPPATVTVSPSDTPVAQAPYPYGTPKAVLTVAPGDTLSGLAAAQCGDGGRWDWLAARNELPDADLIVIGQRLVVECGE